GRLGARGRRARARGLSEASDGAATDARGAGAGAPDGGGSRRRRGAAPVSPVAPDDRAAERAPSPDERAEGGAGPAHGRTDGGSVGARGGRGRGRGRAGASGGAAAGARGDGAGAGAGGRPRRTASACLGRPSARRGGAAVRALAPDYRAYEWAPSTEELAER